MSKTDTLVSLIIGFLIGLFFFIVLKTMLIQIPQDWLIMVVFPPLALLGLFLAAIIGKKFLAVFQLAKFLLVGALNTFIDLGLLNFLMWLSGIYSGSGFTFFKGVSFLPAVTNSYFWNKHWTFGKRNEVFGSREYIKFLMIVLVGFLVNAGTAGLIVNVVGPQFGISDQLWANIGALLAVFTGFVWNFIGSKFIVFKK